MALRVLVYTGLLYQDLIHRGASGPDGRLPPVLPIVLYNGRSPWTAELDMSRLIAPVGEDLARHQPSQRYFLLDERRYGGDDLPRRNLFSAVMQLENSRSVADIKRAVDALIEWLQDPVHQAIKRSFAEWIRQVLVPRRFGASEPGSGTPGPDSPVVGRADRRIAGRAVGSVRAPHPTPAPPASSRDTAIHAPPSPSSPPAATATAALNG